MPKINNVGQSHHTIVKQDMLCKTINAEYYALSGIGMKRGWDITFNWIYTNSGNGKHPEYGCDGSPVIFQDEMIQKKHPYMVYCIEKDPNNIESLKNSMIQNDYVKYYNADHNEVIPRILSNLNYNSHGILYHDPNGEPSWDMLINASRNQKTNKVDFLIHVSVTNGVKRLLHQGRGDLIDSIRKINKSYWYILPCHHIGSDAFQWCFLFGTQFEEFKSLKHVGYKRLDESDGESILNIVNHKKQTPPREMIASQKPLNAFLGVI